jgi:hypothetical protein
MRAKRKTASNLPSFAHYCSHATWISWNNQSSKGVIVSSISIVSFY